MDLKTLLFTRENGIGLITLNRPQTMNGINNELLQEVSDLIDAINRDTEIKSVIITGGSKLFAAGGDISYISSLDPLQAEKFVALAHQAFSKVEQLDKPVIAAVSGLALGGGCELVLACDFCVAADNAKFGLPEINLGIMPGAGGTQRLSRAVGPAWARYLIYTGEHIDADTAFRIGLVSRIVTPDQVMAEAVKIATKLALKSSIALKTAKRCITHGLNVDLASGLVFEQKSWAFLFSTEDPKEGLNAFLEKRKPFFKDY